MSVESSFLACDDKPGMAWLVELPGVCWTAEDALAARQRLPACVLDIMVAADQDETWVYVFPHGAADRLFASSNEAAYALLGATPGDAPAFRARILQGLKQLGDSGSAPAHRWHYTAQTDIEAQEEDEFNEWFDQEHLPLLAKVPGTVRARRYRTDGTPRYLACYDLQTRETHGSPAWKAAASTPWRNKIHESFVSPRRMMFMRLL